MFAVSSSRVGAWGATAVVAVLGAAFALAGASSASAATVGHWGAFDVSGSSRAYTGSMTLTGFPATTITSTSRQATVISGATVWQGPATPPGSVYGTSRGSTYLNQRPSADNQNPASAARTVYSFQDPTPVGGWSFVLGDVDADQATISATDPTGAPVPIADLGYDGSYNSCSTVSAGGWSCGRATDDDPTPGSDTPTWDPATGTLVGNAGADDTAGASAWFSPTVALGTLTIRYQQRSGLPVYQTWFADATAALTGAVTLDGAVVPGAAVTATDTSGTVHRTTTGADGTYSFPDLVRSSGDYTVAVEAPPGALGAATAGVSLAAGDAAVPFAFTQPVGTATLVGTVTTTIAGQSVPATDVPVTVTTTTGPEITTTTDDDGDYGVSGLPLGDVATISVPGASTTVPTGDGSAPVVVPPLETTPADVGVVSGTATLDGAAYPGATVTLTDGSGTDVATTTSDAGGSFAFPAVDAGAYTVSITAPGDATGSDSVPVTVTADQETVVRFAFVSVPPVATATVTGTLIDSTGAPVADTDVTATAATGDSVTSATDANGVFELDGLLPSTAYTISAEGASLTVTTPASGSLAVGPLVLPAPPTTGGGTGTGTGGTGTGGSGAGGGAGTGTGAAPTGGASPVSADPGGIPAASFGEGDLAYTGSNPTPALVGAGILVLMGIVFLVTRAVRGRRDHHLEDD